MKVNLILLTALTVLLSFSCGGNKSRIDPPQSVQSKFEIMFGVQRDVRWESPGENIFQASFARDGHPTTAYFNEKASWLKTETELLPSEVPSVIISTVTGAFHGRSIAKALHIDESGKELIYRLYLKKGRLVSTVDLNTDGVILINTIR